MTDIVWIVARPVSYEEPHPIAWCSTPQLARKHAADYWAVTPGDPITIGARRLDTTDFDAPGEFWFGGDRDDAVEVGWLGADGVPVEEVPGPGESVEAPVVVVSDEAPSIWG